MRIGLLTPELSASNGWAAYSLYLTRALRAHGVDISVVCARNSKPVDFETNPLLPTVTPPDKHTFLKTLWLTPRARRILRHCDIVHATAEPYAILAQLTAAGRPLFVTAHGSYVNLPRLRRFPVGALYRRAFARARLICVSRHTAAVARQLIPGARTQVINNGFDAAELDLVQASPVEKRGPTVVTLGEIKPRKGTLQLVEAMAAVRQRLPEAQCLIMGNPQFGSAYTARVQRRIAELGLADCVRILGFVDADVKRAWLAAADVFALPAINDGPWFEGFGLALLEAGAAGTAVVGTDGCGVADAIVAGVSGIVVSQARIADELPRALLSLLEDPALAARMGAAGRQYALAQTWDKVAEAVIALYQAALDQSVGGRRPSA